MDNSPVGIAVRVSVLYVYALVLLRLSGKQSMSSLSALDFIVGLILGDLFDDVIWTEIPVVQGLVGLTTIILTHVLVTLAASRSTVIHHLVSPAARLVIKEGMLVTENLQKERMNTASILSQMRLNGEDRLDEVKEAWLEPKGEVSILKKEGNKTLRKQEYSQLR